MLNFTYVSKPDGSDLRVECSYAFGFVTLEGDEALRFRAFMDAGLELSRAGSDLMFKAYGLGDEACRQKRRQWQAKPTRTVA